MTANTLTHIDNSDFVVAKRRKWVLEQILLGRTPTDIKEDWQQQYPVLSLKSFDVDRTKAYEILKTVLESDEDLITRHLALYDTMVKDNLKDNPKIAIEAMKAKERLKKLHSPSVAVQINQHTNSISLPEMSLEDIKKLLNNNSSTGQSPGNINIS